MTISALLTSPFPTLQMLEDYLTSLGANAAHQRRLWRAWLGLGDWSALNTKKLSLPKAVIEAVPGIRAFLESVARVRSTHPGSEPETARLLVQLSDNKTVESVLLPRQGVCVSSQLGCAVGCRFCMTGKGGLLRQLSDLEIVAQVALARAQRPTTKKVVFMGMGEPSHNREAVLSALRFLALYGEFGHKDLVISTVGDARLFESLLAQEDIRPALAISLHTVDDEKRRHLLPKAGKLTVDELLAFGARWGALSGYPVQYEWTLIEGVNDSLDEMELLAQKLQGQYAMVNLIPVNAVEGSAYHRPQREHCVECVRHLRSRGLIATLRDSAAQDVDGGCGQLRAREVGLDG